MQIRKMDFIYSARDLYDADRMHNIINLSDMEDLVNAMSLMKFLTQVILILLESWCDDKKNLRVNKAVKRWI